MVYVVYNKTNVHDTKYVLHTYNLINSWLKRFSSEHKEMPIMFDYKFFFSGMRAVLDEENSQPIAKVLQVIYDNFHIFPNDFKKEICEFLLGNIFFKLFMHWCYNVRLMFHHFLIY